jgi:hypothetical protein
MATTAFEKLYLIGLEPEFMMPQVPMPIASNDGMGQFLAMINGAWMVMCFAVAAITAAYIWRETQGKHFDAISWWRGQMPLNVQLAVAIFVLHAGNFMVRGLLWLWRYTVGTVTMDAPTALTGWLIGAFALALIGEVLVMRVIARTWMGDWPWVASLLAAGLFALAMAPF